MNNTHPTRQMLLRSPGRFVAAALAGALLLLTYIAPQSICAAGEQQAGNIDYTKLARSLVRYPDNPVIKVGKKGMWDDQTLGCFTVLDDGDNFFFYSGGTQFGKSKSIGMGTSRDGIHWTKHEKNPLFGQRSTQHPHQGFRVAMRPTGVQGVALAVEPFEERRKLTIDPGPRKVDTAAADKHPKELTLDLPGKVTMEFVLIQPGSFLMGSNRGFVDEMPVHRVVISKPFYMAKHETTTSQWAAVMGMRCSSIFPGSLLLDSLFLGNLVLGSLLLGRLLPGFLLLGHFGVLD